MDYKSYTGENWGLYGLETGICGDMTERQRENWSKRTARRHTCPICRKPFFVEGTNWAYRAEKRAGEGTYFCSYSCLRKWQKPKEAQKRNLIQRELSGLYYREDGSKIETKTEVA